MLRRITSLLISITAFLLVNPPASAEAYTWDALGRLTKVEYDDGSSIDYRYDRRGNIEQMSLVGLVIPPDGVIDTPTGDVTITAGESIDFTGTGSDPDNALPLAYRWDFDGAAPDSNDEDPGPITFANAGSYEVEFHVTDATGIPDPTPATRTITVNAAAPPPQPAPGPGGNPPAPKPKNGGAADWLVLMLAGLVVMIRRFRMRAAVVALVGCFGITSVSAQQWLEVPSPTTMNLNAVWGAAPDDLYAVGDDGTLLHFDGGQWSVVQIVVPNEIDGSPADLHSVFGYASDDIYVVGDAGTVLRFDGLGWNPVDVSAAVGVLPEDMIDAWTAGPGKPFYVLSRNRAYKLVGGSWELVAFQSAFSSTFTPDAYLTSIGGAGDTAIVTSTRAFSSAGGFFVMTNGISFVQISGDELLSSWGVAEDDIYAAGRTSRRFTGGDAGHISSWRPVSILETPLDVWGTNANGITNVYAVGSIGGSGRISFFDGNVDNRWTGVHSTVLRLNGIFGFDTGEIFVVGDGGQIWVPGAANDPVTWSNHPFSGMATEFVNAHTGEVTLNEQDVLLDGKLPLAYTRYYASAMIEHDPIGGEHGPNWTHNYDWYIEFDEVGGVQTASIISPRGQLIRFELAASGEWSRSTPDHTPFQLVDTGNEFVLLDPISEFRYHFGDFFGTLNSIRDRNGLTLDLIYDIDTQRLTQIRRSNGGVIDIDHNAESLISRVYVNVLDDMGNLVEHEVRYTYNDGILSSVTDVLDGVTSYEYDAAHALDAQLTAIELPEGNRPFTWAYDAQGRAIVQTNARGDVVDVAYGGAAATLVDSTDVVTGELTSRSYTHDATGNLTQVIDENNATVKFEYDGNGRRGSLTDALDDRTHWEFSDDNGKLLRVTDADGRVTQYTYEPAALPSGVTFHDLTRIDYPDGTNEQFLNPVNGNPTVTIDRFGNTWQYDYDVAGNVTRLTNPFGAEFVLEYQQQGLLSSAKDPSMNNLQVLYDGFGNIRETKTGGNGEQVFKHDARGRLLSITNRAGQASTFAYDGNHNLTSFTPSNGRNPMIWTYDNIDRPVAVTSPAGDLVSYFYDAGDRIVQIRDAAGSVLDIDYDAAGRPIELATSDQRKWKITLDKEDSLTTLQADDSNSTAFETTLNGRGIPSRVDDQRSNSSIEFDATGLAMRRVGGDGGISDVFHGAANLAQTVVLEDPNVGVAFTHDPSGLLEAFTDPGGHVWQFGYDDVNRLVSRANPSGEIVGYEYDDRNRVSRVSLPNNRGYNQIGWTNLGQIVDVRYINPGNAVANPPDRPEVAFTYDNQGRVVTGAASTTATDATLVLGYDFDNLVTASNGIVYNRGVGGRVESMVFEDGNTITYHYGVNGELTSVDDWAGQAMTFSYTAGRLDRIGRTNGIRTDIGYAGRLLDSIDEPNNLSISILRDGAGRPLDIRRSAPAVQGVWFPETRTLQFDEASRIVGFDYDANGNRTTGRGKSYSYNSISLLTAIDDGVQQKTYRYDPYGRLIGKQSSDGQIELTWGYGFARPVISLGANLTTGDTRYYVHSPAGHLLYSITASGARTYYHYDEAGNTVYLSNGSGAVVQTYVYTPYGKVLRSDGSEANPFTFRGRDGVIQDGDSRLYFDTDGRVYNADTGSYLQQHAQPSVNAKRMSPYQYSEGNPLAMIAFRDERRFRSNPVGAPVHNIDVGESKGIELLGRRHSIAADAVLARPHGPGTEASASGRDPGAIKGRTSRSSAAAGARAFRSPSSIPGHALTPASYGSTASTLTMVADTRMEDYVAVKGRPMDAASLIPVLLANGRVAGSSATEVSGLPRMVNDEMFGITFSVQTIGADEPDRVAAMLAEYARFGRTNTDPRSSRFYYANGGDNFGIDRLNLPQIGAYVFSDPLSGWLHQRSGEMSKRLFQEHIYGDTRDRLGTSRRSSVRRFGY